MFTFLWRCGRCTRGPIRVVDRQFCRLGTNSLLAVDSAGWAHFFILRRNVFFKKDFFRVFWERCRRHFGRSMWRPERRFGRPSWVRRDPLHCTEPNCHFLYLAFLCYSKTLMIDWPNDCGDTLGAHTGLRGGIVQILINNLRPLLQQDPRIKWTWDILHC